MLELPTNMISPPVASVHLAYLGYSAVQSSTRLRATMFRLGKPPVRPGDPDGNCHRLVCVWPLYPAIASRRSSRSRNAQRSEVAARIDYVKISPPTNAYCAGSGRSRNRTLSQNPQLATLAIAFELSRQPPCKLPGGQVKHAEPRFASRSCRRTPPHSAQPLSAISSCRPRASSRNHACSKEMAAGECSSR